jgi:hypothetical protein
MAAGPAYIGVTECSDALCQSVEVERKHSVDVVRKAADGTFAMAHAADPVSTFTIVILGAADDAVGEALTTTLASLSGGKALVLEKTHKRVNDNYDETTVAGEHYGSATV